jgi:Ser/Thr protein kinase RdoA (MazF antagonist)
MGDAIDPEALRGLLARWGVHLEDARVTPISIGLINRTLRVDDASGPRILQRLHPIFAPEVNLDIEAITAHLAARGLTTPRLLRTLDGAPFVRDDAGATWRALSFVPGDTVARVEEPWIAAAAGRLVGAFHRAVADLEHAFAFTRHGAHDTPAHLATLCRALVEHAEHPRFAAVSVVAREILAHADALAPLPAPPAIPMRIIHGDLKITNVLLDRDARAATALVDLDTMAASTLPIELGDALRSWCNPGGEDDREARFDAAIFEAAVRAYAEATGPLLTAAERDALVLGVETIATELSARFCADALNERYFGWDAARFATRGEHNELRARSQLAVARSVRAQRDALETIVARAFAAR